MSMIAFVTIHESGGFHGLEVISNAFTIVTTYCAAAKPGSVNGLDVTYIVEVTCQSKNCSPDPHFEFLFSATERREVR